MAAIVAYKPFMIVTGTPCLGKTFNINKLMSLFPTAILIEEQIDKLQEYVPVHQDDMPTLLGSKFGQLMWMALRSSEIMKVLFSDNARNNIVIADRFITCGLLFTMAHQFTNHHEHVTKMKAVVEVSYELLKTMSEQKPIELHVAVMDSAFRNIKTECLLKRIEARGGFDKNMYNKNAIKNVDSVFVEWYEKLTLKMLETPIRNCSLFIHRVGEFNPLLISAPDVQ
ncbi:hypothetical protein [Ranid herpesvirus 3]|uniref:Uncharacterized protein n=1 Tax=Ranid herpesvirus 3 TaxID=1987509 RepID=A0A1X9T580_9VIRU|nr:hypothetical protein [Ranid herpesvirus 3]ARR28861.1 hypothetical protein [Ranid herpesvirus 3]